jgi:hypothetical protein
MPTPMPIGGRCQSVAVALTVPFVFSSRSQTGPVGSRTLFGNAVGGVTRHEGSNPSRSASLQNKGVRFYRACGAAYRWTVEDDERSATFARRLGLFLNENDSIDQIFRRRMSEVPRRRSRAETRAVSPPPGPSAVPRGHRGPLVATESFSYAGPSTSRRVHVKAGLPMFAPERSAFAVRPSAFVAP